MILVGNVLFKDLFGLKFVLKDNDVRLFKLFVLLINFLNLLLLSKVIFFFFLEFFFELLLYLVVINNVGKSIEDEYNSKVFFSFFIN